ncbi:MAG: DUF3854 domain-containing protein [Thermodesulfobacteriota bacterium]|jgi:hypothetical protein
MTDNHDDLSLPPDQLTDLRKSGLLDETIREAGIYSARPGDIPKKLGFNDPSIESLMVFPYPGTNGFERFKPFPVRPGKPKYLQRKGSGNHLYIPSSVRGIFQDSGVPLYITEGEKKVLRATQEGIYCIGVSGWWNWKQKGKGLISDFDLIIFEARRVILVPDDDWKHPGRYGGKIIEKVVYSLVRELSKRGARMFLKELNLNHREKGGQ